MNVEQVAVEVSHAIVVVGETIAPKEFAIAADHAVRGIAPECLAVVERPGKLAGAGDIGRSHPRSEQHLKHGAVRRDDRGVGQPGWR